MISVCSELCVESESLTLTLAPLPSGQTNLSSHTLDRFEELFYLVSRLSISAEDGETLEQSSTTVSITASYSVSGSVIDVDLKSDGRIASPHYPISELLSPPGGTITHLCLGLSL